MPWVIWFNDWLSMPQYLSIWYNMNQSNLWWKQGISQCKWPSFTKYSYQRLTAPRTKGLWLLIVDCNVLGFISAKCILCNYQNIPNQDSKGLARNFFNWKSCLYCRFRNNLRENASSSRKAWQSRSGFSLGLNMKKLHHFSLALDNMSKWQIGSWDKALFW